MAFVFFLGASNLYATPLMGESNYGQEYYIDVNYDMTYDYTVVNQKQDTDIWSNTYGGYSMDNTDADTNFTGYYLGTVLGNDNFDLQHQDLQAILAYYLSQSGVTYEFAKVEFPDTVDDVLTVTYNAGNKTGTWVVVGGVEVYFYTVKASTEYALYYVDPASTSGVWTTAHLVNNKGNIPTISHLTVATDPGTSVPEPATMLLFGTGIAGLAGVIRRKRD